MAAIRSLGNFRAKARPAARPLPVPLSASVVNCGVYVDGERLPGRWTHGDAIAEARKHEGGFVWIGLHEPHDDQIKGIADAFGLHELAVEDAVQAHQRPKLDRYEDMLFMVLKTVNYVAHESPTTANEIVETGELMAFLGKDFIVTVRHGHHSGLARVRADLDDDPERLQLGPATVLHAIADHVVDGYLDVSKRIEDDIDELEADVFAPRSQVTAEQIYLMKREVLELRRAVFPLATPLRRLAEGYTRLVPDEIRSYFRDVDDHLTTTSERIGSANELLTTLVDAAVAKISLQQNTDMRKLAAWAALFAVPTAITGVYGMNFDNIPELHWHYGYYGALALVVVICSLLVWIFRKQHWL